MAKPDWPRGSFLGLPLFLGTTRQFINGVMDRAIRTEPGEPLTISYLNAWTTVLASRDKNFADLLAERVGLVYADGMGVVWAARRLGLYCAERVNAADFIVEFLRETARRGLSVYFLGGAEGVASAAAARWQALVPDLIVAGTAHGYFSDGAEAARAIAGTNADLVIVGLGSPGQELWAANHGAATGARVVWCVGAMMEYHAGRTARAPAWMRACGLEWLFRLLVEPRRLWYRYLVGNVRFLWLVARGRPLR